MDITRLRRLSPLHYFFLLILHSAHHGHALLAVPLPPSRGGAASVRWRGNNSHGVLLPPSSFALVVPSPKRSSRGLASAIRRHAPSSPSVVRSSPPSLAAASDASSSSSAPSGRDYAAEFRGGSIAVARSDGSSHRLSYRIARPMSLSSRQAAPVVVLHGGPSVPSNYLYPLVDVVPYRSIVFHDQLGCGSSDEPPDVSLYSMRDSDEDMKALLKLLGLRRFHLYGQSYGGILAFEYLKSVATEGDDDGSAPVCLSAILSSAPTNVAEVESEFVSLIQEIASSSAEDSKTEAELAGVVSGGAGCRKCRVSSRDAYAGARSVWMGASGDIRLRGLAPPPPGGRGEDASGNDNEGRARLRERVVRRGGGAIPSTRGVQR